jgi:hypothetical protein
MPKFKVTWWARYEAVVEAETADEAKGKADFTNSQYMGVDDELIDGVIEENEKEFYFNRSYE